MQINFAEFHVFIGQHLPHIIGISESWCSSSISNAEIHLKSYNLYRLDRSCTVGGVLLYVHESLPTVMCEKLMDSTVDDSLWCMITLPDSSKLLIGVTYRSPSSSEDNNSKLIDVISNLWNYQECSHLLLMGDFNVPNIDWQECMCFQNSSTFETKFLNATLDNF